MWVVVLTSHLRYHVSACWGPFPGEGAAQRFADHITAEVDPAIAIRVMNPDSEPTWPPKAITSTETP